MSIPRLLRLRTVCTTFRSHIHQELLKYMSIEELVDKDNEPRYPSKPSYTFLQDQYDWYHYHDSKRPASRSLSRSTTGFLMVNLEEYILNHIHNPVKVVPDVPNFINRVTDTLIEWTPKVTDRPAVRKRYLRNLVHALATNNKIATGFVLDNGHETIGGLTKTAREILYGKGLLKALEWEFILCPEQKVQCMLAAAASVGCTKAKHCISCGATIMQWWPDAVIGFHRPMVAAGRNGHSEVRAYLLEQGKLEMKKRREDGRSCAAEQVLFNRKIAAAKDYKTLYALLSINPVPQSAAT